MNLDELRSRRTEILALAEKHGARNIRIFGSTVRGEATSASDIDLLIDVGEHPSPFFPGGLLIDLEELLGRKVDLVTEKALHWYIREQILREALPL